ncbi:hypothetical protein TWF694_007561 [Orbilia ellipsospora]|uniref:Uncharacterized protein n=1 Tax=Orbilia ellipsospora TaxID=2528407 RepID=A0AAV9XLH2_9PEZI
MAGEGKEGMAAMSVSQTTDGSSLSLCSEGLVTQQHAKCKEFAGASEGTPKKPALVGRCRGGDFFGSRKRGRFAGRNSDRRETATCLTRARSPQTSHGCHSLLRIIPAQQTIIAPYMLIFCHCPISRYSCLNDPFRR